MDVIGKSWKAVCIQDILEVLYIILTRNNLCLCYITWSLLQRKKGSSFITSKISSKNLFNQNISIIKTNTFDDIKKKVHFGIIVQFLSWRQQKHKCLFWLLRFSDKLFDVMNDDPFLMLYKLKLMSYLRMLGSFAFLIQKLFNW